MLNNNKKKYILKHIKKYVNICVGINGAGLFLAPNEMEWLELWLYNCYLIKMNEWESDIIKCEKGVAGYYKCAQTNCQPSVQNMKTYRIIHGPIEKVDQKKNIKILSIILLTSDALSNYFWFHWKDQTWEQIKEMKIPQQ